VDALANGTASASPQVGEVTLAPKLTLSDGRIDWSQSAEVIANLVRGVTPEPGAFTTLDGTRLKVLDAIVARDVPRSRPGHLALAGKAVTVGTASEPIQLVIVQPAGKKPMPAADWWRGRPADAAVVAE
jgi:methionyl-tRNA formyltransferase